NNQLIALALQNDFDAELAVYESMPKHRFSLRFKRRMRKLLGGGVPECETKHIPLRKAVTLAIITVILLAFITGATLLIYKLWDKFQLHDVGEHSFLVALDIEGAPMTLEEKYRLGIDLSGYSETVLSDDEYEYWAEYHELNGNRVIGFSQSIKEQYQDESFWLNTENAMVMPMEIMVNNCKGIFFQNYLGDMEIIWDCGDYIIQVGGYSFSKDELILLAETVQKVE
ncbi:MAG: DUF4367 domain-containing protein, partial [Oscillospiraceae bacterium]